VPFSYLFAGVAVTDFASSHGWYELLFGRPPDRFPTEDEAVWQLTDTGLVYIVGDGKRAGHALLTLAVDDLDDHLAQLAQRGLQTGPIETEPGQFRRVVLADPDGNKISLFEVPGSAG